MNAADTMQTYGPMIYIAYFAIATVSIAFLVAELKHAFSPLPQLVGTPQMPVRKPLAIKPMLKAAAQAASIKASPAMVAANAS